MAFKHACQVLQNFDPLTFPPSEGVTVKVQVANTDRTYYFPQSKTSLLEKQVKLLDKVTVHIEDEKPK